MARLLQLRGRPRTGLPCPHPSVLETLTKPFLDHSFKTEQVTFFKPELPWQPLASPWPPPEPQMAASSSSGAPPPCPHPPCLPLGTACGPCGPLLGVMGCWEPGALPFEGHMGT